MGCCGVSMRQKLLGYLSACSYINNRIGSESCQRICLADRCSVCKWNEKNYLQGEKETVLAVSVVLKDMKLLLISCDLMAHSLATDFPWRLRRTLLVNPLITVMCTAQVKLTSQNYTILLKKKKNPVDCNFCELNIDINLECLTFLSDVLQQERSILPKEKKVPKYAQE